MGRVTLEIVQIDGPEASIGFGVWGLGFRVCLFCFQSLLNDGKVFESTESLVLWKSLSSQLLKPYILNTEPQTLLHKNWTHTQNREATNLLIVLVRVIVLVLVIVLVIVIVIVIVNPKPCDFTPRLEVLGSQHSAGMAVGHEPHVGHLEGPFQPSLSWETCLALALNPGPSTL